MWNKDDVEREDGCWLTRRLWVGDVGDEGDADG